MNDEQEKGEESMSIMVDIPTAMVEQTKAYEQAIGISLERMLRDYLLEKVRQRQQADEILRDLDELAERSKGRLTEPYVFNRADAYEPEIPYA